MLETGCESAVQRQAAGVSGDHVVAGRKSGGADAGDELPEKVRIPFLWHDGAYS